MEDAELDKALDRMAGDVPAPASERPAGTPALVITGPGGKVYEIWANGHMEGFGDKAIISINRIPRMIAEASGAMSQHSAVRKTQLSRMRWFLAGAIVSGTMVTSYFLDVFDRIQNVIPTVTISGG